MVIIEEGGFNMTNSNSQVESMKKNVWTVPNILSFIRIILVPVYLITFLKGEYNQAMIIVVFSGLTDFLDGWIARKFNQISELGKMLDPLADKLTQMILAVSFYYSFKESADQLLRSFSPIFWFFVIKEALMVIGAIILIKMEIKPSAAKMTGKVATFAYYIVMILLLCFAPVFGAFHDFFVMPTMAIIILVSVSVILTLVAFFSYLPGAIEQVKVRYSKKDEK